MELASNTYERRSHPNSPSEFWLLIDVDRNDADDYQVTNAEVAPGQNGIFVKDKLDPDFADPNAAGQFIDIFTDTALVSSNLIMTVPLFFAPTVDPNSPTLTPSTTFRFKVEAYDSGFHSFAKMDEIPYSAYTLNALRFTSGCISPTTGVPVGSATTLFLRAERAGNTLAPSQRRILLMYRDAMEGGESDPIILAP